MKTRINIGFRSKHQMGFQMALFMIVKEYYDDTGEIIDAKILFQIKGKKLRNAEKQWRKENER